MENVDLSIKRVIGMLMANVDDEKKTRVIGLGLGDPTVFSCFTTASVVEDAVLDALTSHKFNGYSPTVGLPQTRRAISEYLSMELPYKLSPDDVYVTAGCTQAIEVAISILATPKANILVPRPGFPIYDLCAAFKNVEMRHFDLLPEMGWEVDLDAVDALVDENMVAIVVINPGNPCGNVYSYQHLKKIAETAKKHKIVVIADEVYGHLVFGPNPFVPMDIFGSMVPVLTLGSLSKRWLVPGWRLGWFVTIDPNGIFKSAKTAVPRILKETSDAFFARNLSILKQSADLCIEKIKDIPCLTCPTKPQGSMAVMVKLNVSMLKDIIDDIEFCFKVARKDSVVLLPGDKNKKDFDFHPHLICID